MHWLGCVEHYFRIYRASKQECFQSVVSYMEGDAADWFDYQDNCGTFADYEDFMEQFIEHLGIKQNEAYH